MSTERRDGTDVELMGDGTEVLALQTEIGALKRRLEQRELALAGLNRRLMTFERGHAGAEEVGVSAMRDELDKVLAERDQLRAEIARIYATKLFRLAGPARRVYGRLRGT